jgi:hypothetical protein
MLRDGEIFEVKCDSRFCGAEPGVVVLHQFSTKTGELVGTQRYKDTPKIDKKDRRVA